jgi:hypothetical protein
MSAETEKEDPAMVNEVREAQEVMSAETEKEDPAMVNVVREAQEVMNAEMVFVAREKLQMAKK